MVIHAPPAILVRPLVASDAPAFRALRLEALAGTPEAFGSSYEEESPLPIEAFRDRIPQSGSNRIFGAFSDDTLVGMAGFMVYERVKTNHKGLMWGVFVKPEWRKRRLGKELVQRVIDHAAQHVIMLEAAVGMKNESARRVYHELGFKPYGIERKAIRVGEEFHDEELLFMDLPKHERS